MKSSPVIWILCAALLLATIVMGLLGFAIYALREDIVDLGKENEELRHHNDESQLQLMELVAQRDQYKSDLETLRQSISETAQ